MRECKYISRPFSGNKMLFAKTNLRKLFDEDNYLNGMKHSGSIKVKEMVIELFTIPFKMKITKISLANLSKQILIRSEGIFAKMFFYMACSTYTQIENNVNVVK